MLWAWLAVHWIVAADLRPLAERCRQAFLGGLTPPALCNHGGFIPSAAGPTPHPTDWLRAWCDDQPLCVGEHAWFWYQARFRLSPWRPVAWDGTVYGGYLLTPWWDVRGRLATLWLAGNDSWSAYKLGLMTTLLSLPIFWSLAGRWFGGSFASAWLTMLANAWFFWLGPGAVWLATGELDLLAASGLVPMIVAGWCAWQRDGGWLTAVATTVALALVLWVYPLAGLCLLVFGVVWYLRVGARQSVAWHLMTLTLTVPVVLLQWPSWRAMLATWWLFDWHSSESVAGWEVFCHSWRDGLSLAVCFASATLGCWRGVGDRSAGRTWWLAMLALALAALCPSLPLPEGWQVGRLAWLFGPMTIVPIASLLLSWRCCRPASSPAESSTARQGYTDTVSSTSKHDEPPTYAPEPVMPSPEKSDRFRLGLVSRIEGSPLAIANQILGVVLAVAALVGLTLTLGDGQFTTRPAQPSPTTSTDRHTDARDSTGVGEPAVLATLLDWLTRYTTLDARIFLEEDADCWSPILIARSGRLFVNGLARETPLAQDEFRWHLVASSESVTGQWRRRGDTGDRTRMPSADEHNRWRAHWQGGHIFSNTPALANRDSRSYLASKPLQDRAAEEMTAWLDRWNVGWLLVRQPTTVEWLTRLPNTQILAHEPQTGWTLLSRPFPGYFARGQGRLLRIRPGEVTWADLQPEGGRCELRLAYVPGLITSLDRCRITAAPTHASAWPQLQLLLATPTLRLTIRFEESANFLHE